MSIMYLINVKNATEYHVWKIQLVFQGIVRKTLEVSDRYVMCQSLDTRWHMAYLGIDTSHSITNLISVTSMLKIIETVKLFEPDKACM